MWCFKPYHDKFVFVQNALSAYCICCIYSDALQANFVMKANNTNPDQAAPMRERQRELLIVRKGLI